MIGLDRHTGARLGGHAHIAQSIGDILTTPIGSRVQRREYGSRIPELIDQPINSQTVIEFYVATAEALERWEPRIELTRVRLDKAGADGRVSLTIDYDVLDEPQQTGVVIDGGRA